MEKSKLDAGLRYVHASGDKARLETQFTCFDDLDDPVVPARKRVNVLLEIEADSDELKAGLVHVGFRQHARSRSIMSGDVPIANVRDLDALPGLKRVEASRVLHHELDEALPESGVRVSAGKMPYEGDDVIIGIIDSGIDFTHPAFRNEDGTSRILAIWDQGLPRLPGDLSPQPYNYGVEYSQQQINDALMNPPKADIRHHDKEPFHGTHVAGIAAGNGRPGSGGVVKYVGMAPNADLVVVANTRGQDRNPGTLGDSADTFDAITFIIQFAAKAGKAVVINHSHGDNIGPHDGSSLLEVGIDELITGHGVVMVKSAGNERDRAHHAYGSFEDRKPHLVDIDVSPQSTEVLVDFWYRRQSEDDRLELRIVSPGGEQHHFQATVAEQQFRFANGNIAYVFTDEDDAVNHDDRIFVVLQDGDSRSIETGKWRFELNGSGSWHGWIQRGSLATFCEPFIDQMGTISIPGTAKNIISVGAYVNEGVFSAHRAGELSDISSCGPTRDGRPAPTLTAPGDEITSTIPDPAFFGPMKGTSMSAPLVAGAAALILQINKKLTAKDVREILTSSARQDGFTRRGMRSQWGAGKLDVHDACKRAKATVRLSAAVQLKRQKSRPAPQQPPAP
jgi:subtilisin family serine protease